MTRVVIITPAFPPGMHVGGGVAVTYKVLAEKLAALPDMEVTVLSTWNGRLDYVHVVLDPEFRVIRCSPRNLQIMRDALYSADVVVCPDNGMLPWIVLQAYRKGLPSVWVMHTNFMRLAEHRLTKLEHAFFSGLINFIFRRISNMTSHVYTTSRDYLAFLREAQLPLEGYINQGFKTDIFREPDDPADVAALRQELTGGRKGRPLLIFAGRLSNEKRIDLVIKAKPSECTLVLVGDGYLRDQLQEMHSVEDGLIVITTMLPQAKLRLYYKAADLIVSASDFETYGMTIHEALLCGTPAVVQDAKGFRMQVREGVNGFLVDYADTAAATAAIRRGLRHKFSNPAPVPDPNAIDLVDAVVRAAAEKRAPPNAAMRALLLLLQWMHVATLSIVFFFYSAKPPTRFSRLPSAPPSSKPKNT